MTYKVIEIKTCKTCNGSGIRENINWTQYFEEHPPELSEEQPYLWFSEDSWPIYSKDNYPPIEIACYCCSGRGEFTKQVDLEVALQELSVVQSSDLKGKEKEDNE